MCEAGVRGQGSGRARPETGDRRKEDRMFWIIGSSVTGGFFLAVLCVIGGVWVFCRKHDLVISTRKFVMRGGSDEVAGVAP